VHTQSCGCDREIDEIDAGEGEIIAIHTQDMHTYHAHTNRSRHLPRLSLPAWWLSKLLLVVPLGLAVVRCRSVLSSAHEA